MTNTIICPDCRVELPVLEEDGRHNFVPYIREGRMIMICIKCRVDMFIRHWKWQDWAVDVQSHQEVNLCS